VCVGDVSRTDHYWRVDERRLKTTLIAGKCLGGAGACFGASLERVNSRKAAPALCPSAPRLGHRLDPARRFAYQVGRPAAPPEATDGLLMPERSDRAGSSCTRRSIPSRSGTQTGVIQRVAVASVTPTLVPRSWCGRPRHPASNASASPRSADPYPPA
jgi:hypothetical protein